MHAPGVATWRGARAWGRGRRGAGAGGTVTIERETPDVTWGGVKR